MKYHELLCKVITYSAYPGIAMNCLKIVLIVIHSHELLGVSMNRHDLSKICKYAS